MMEIDNVTALPSVYCAHLTNMSRTIETTPRRALVLIRVSKHQSVTKLTTNTRLKAPIGNKTNYYPTLSIFFNLQNHLLTSFDATYRIIHSFILTHSNS